MAMEDRLKCHGCGRAVVPQLWVDTRDQMSHPKVRHLCPLCGATLRVSGGGFDRWMVTIVIGTVILLVIFFIFVVME
jgi:ribosomal protein S27E